MSDTREEGDELGLDGLRARLRGLDERLVELAADRVRTVREIGERKRTGGLPIRDYGVERSAIEHARTAAEGEGSNPDLAEELVKLLIKEALRVQERDAHAERHIGEGDHAVLVGGAGDMGRWFTEFLRGTGFHVTTVDPAGPVPGVDHAEDLTAVAPDADLVVVASPPSTVDGVLATLEGSTDALVFDIASLKGPFQDRLLRMAKSGQAVTSLHPMWGPNTDLLADKNLLVLHCGHEDATEAARQLFTHTAVHVLDMPVEAHDSVMAYTLGLPHAMNILFADVLRAGPHGFDHLDHHGGPTFTKQVNIARELAGENRHLYYEIQTLNDHTPEVFNAIRSALDELKASLEDREAFVDRMDANMTYFSGGGGD